MEHSKEIYTAEEVAEALRVSRTTIIRLINNGELKGKRIGRQWRIFAEHLDEYILSEQEYKKE